MIIVYIYFSKNKVVPDSSDAGQENIYTISGGGADGLDGDDKQVGAQQDQDVTSVNKTDKNNAGGNWADKEMILKCWF